jgi:hypothetical protein
MPMMHEKIEQRSRAELYRENARMLRRLAFDMDFDFCRRAQIRALASGFERLADKLEGSPLKQAAG